MTLFGPVFHKELLELSRRRSTYYLRTLAGAALLLVVLFYAFDVPYGAAGQSVTKRQAAIGAVVFERWLWYQFWIICCAMPLLVCNLIAAEREAGSLELLFTTHLTNREIILGKTMSRIFTVLLLMFCALPVLVILSLLGGVDFDRLLKINLITLSSALLIAAAGVYYSVTAKRPWVACLQTYGLFLLFWACVPFVTVVTYQVYAYSQPGTPTGMPPRWLFMTIMAFAPYFDVLFLCDPKGRTMAGWLLDWEGVFSFTGMWLAASALFVGFSMRELRRGPRPSLIGRVSTGVAAFFGRRLRRLTGRQSAPKTRRRFSIGVLERNPIVWRNRRADVYDPDRHLLRLQLGAVILAVVVLALCLYQGSTIGAGRRAGGAFWFILMLETIGLHVMFATIGASAIARERQRGSFDLLLLTELTPSAIIFGTLRGVIGSCAPMILLFAGTLTAAVHYEAFQPGFAIEYGGVIAAYSFALLTAAVFISCAATKAQHAVVAAIVVALSYWWLPTPAGGLYTLMSTAGRDRILLAYFGIYSAVLIAASVIGCSVLSKQRAFVGAAALSIAIPAWLLFVLPMWQRPIDASLLWRWVYDLQGGAYWNSFDGWRNSSQTAPASGTCYALAGILLTTLAIWQFNRIVGRAPIRSRQAPNPPLNGLTTPVLAS